MILSLVFVLVTIAWRSEAQTDKERLLAQRDAITNWDQFAAANSIQGWDRFTDPCSGWTGITCAAGRISAFKWGCDKGQGQCEAKAEGTLAPELAGIECTLGRVEGVRGFVRSASQQGETNPHMHVRCYWTARAAQCCPTAKQAGLAV